MFLLIFFGQTKIQSVSFIFFYALILAGTNIAHVLTNETAWIRLEVKFRVRVPSLNAWIWFDLVWFLRLIILINRFPSWATLTQTILLSDVCTVVSEKYILFALASAIVIECAVHAIYSYCTHVLKFVWNFWYFFHLFFWGPEWEVFLYAVHYRHFANTSSSFLRQYKSWSVVQHPIISKWWLFCVFFPMLALFGFCFASFTILFVSYFSFFLKKEKIHIFFLY